MRCFADLGGIEYGDLCSYRIISTIKNCEAVKSATVFGVEVLDVSGGVLLRINDISPDKTLVQSLVEKCNRHSLSFCHIADVIHDALND